MYSTLAARTSGRQTAIRSIAMISPRAPSSFRAILNAERMPSTYNAACKTTSGKKKCVTPSAPSSRNNAVSISRNPH